MTKKRQTYQERAEQLAQVIDIADNIVNNSKTLDEKTKSHFIKWGQDIKHMALNPKPQFKRVDSLKYLENDFLTYWNESDGLDVDTFWKLLYKNGLNYERKDTIKAVLKRKKIKDIHEYDNVIDNIVVAEQIGRINKDQVVELNQHIAEFEKRQSK